MKKKSCDWRDKFIEDGLTFADILLRPQYSKLQTRADREGGPKTATFLTRNIKLAIPIISANMDTVTGSAMAIAMARLGGIGILHRNCSIAEQVGEVKKVKSAEETLIYDPYTLLPNSSINQLRQLMAEKKIDSVLIVDSFENRRLVGLITKYELGHVGGDEEIGKHMKPVDKLILVKTKKPLTGDKAVQLAKKFFEDQPLLSKLPFIDEDKRLIGLLTKKDLFRFTSFPDATKDESGKLRVGAAIGVDDTTPLRAKELLKAGVDVLVLDVAHAHAKKPMEMIRRIRKDFPKCQLIVGNVATWEAIIGIAALGVDAIKVGIGPGAVCSTRIIAGAGVPQVSAILECVRAAENFKIPIIADGGIRYPRDVSLAIACGASSVMIGTLFAGTDESPGDVIDDNGRLVKIVRGMSSLGANIDMRGDNFIKAGLKDMIQSEGVTGQVPYRGSLIRVLGALVAGLRSGMTYAGAGTIDDLQKPFLRKFSRVSPAAFEESKPHDIKVI